MIKRLVLLPVSLFILASSFAQQRVVADKIASIVGDKIVLKSEIATAISDYQRNGGANNTVDE